MCYFLFLDLSFKPVLIPRLFKQPTYFVAARLLVPADVARFIRDNSTLQYLSNPVVLFFEVRLFLRYGK